MTNLATARADESELDASKRDATGVVGCTAFHQFVSGGGPILSATATNLRQCNWAGSTSQGLAACPTRP